MQTEVWGVLWSQPQKLFWVMMFDAEITSISIVDPENWTTN